MILKVRLSTTCGSDLHLLGGYIPAMRAGDILGHEFMGEVAEVGPAVTKHKPGDRVVVCSFISCGRCWYCEQKLYSLCGNGNPNPAITEALWGYAPGGCFGYSHALGGFAGSHADYIRVPYADQGAFAIPDGVDDMTALFASDAAATGWTAADQIGVGPGDVVAVWGAGAVGQMAARAAMLKGAERVLVIDRLPERLAQVQHVIGAETIDYTQVSAGRGDEQEPDLARRADARPAVHPGDPRPDGARGGQDRPPGYARHAAGRRPGRLPEVQGQGGRLRPGRLQAAGLTQVKRAQARQTGRCDAHQWGRETRPGESQRGGFAARTAGRSGSGFAPGAEGPRWT
jgi:Alcohol dehydrogenase GroES-like domain/Alanine dehydrogenase/PNT, C-terminal domain